MNELEEKSNESWASKVVDYKKQQVISMEGYMVSCRRSENRD